MFFDAYAKAQERSLRYRRCEFETSQISAITRAISGVNTARPFARRPLRLLFRLNFFFFSLLFLGTCP